MKISSYSDLVSTPASLASPSSLLAAVGLLMNLRWIVSSRRLILPIFLSSLVLLSGCGLSDVASDSASTSSLGAIQGRVHGGQQPVSGAHVYLYSTGSTGDGGAGVAASTGNASVSLLNSLGGNTSFDGTNYYVVTGSDGSFSISGDYTCTPGAQLYLYVIGGNPGSGPNSAAAFLAGVGACPSGATTLSPNAFFWVNEVTTVATAYALAGFATDALHISANSAGSSAAAELQATGIANAMANVNNLVNISTGSALFTTPGGNGTVPAATIDTLANILAACVNSSNGNPAGCTSLFGAALSGGSSGNAPTDTATAAINVAHNASQNVSSLYGLQSGLAAPFLPDLSTQPNDFSLAIGFGGGGALNPHSLAIDAGGNVWGLSADSVVNTYSALGVPLSAGGLTPGTSGYLNALLVDLQGNVWVLDSTGHFTEYTSAGTVVSPTGGYTGGTSGTSAVTSDSSGYLWSSNQTDGSVNQFDTSADAVIATYSVGTSGLIAADSGGFIWVGTSSGTLNKLSEGGLTIASYPSLYIQGTSIAVDSTNAAYVDDSLTKEIHKVGSDGTKSAFSDGVSGGQTIAVDGANNIWTGAKSLAELSSTGANLSGSGFALPSGTSTSSIAVDGSGDLWSAATSENSGGQGTHYLEYIGIAVPALTPLSYAATHGTRQAAQNLGIGFNGPDVQVPYETQFYTASSAYFQSMGETMPGVRYCHAYLSWDVAEQAVGSGPVGTEGSRAWFENWLSTEQGNCDRALVTFKYISGITVQDVGSSPSISDYSAGMAAFMSTSWAYTGWIGAIDFTAWNEPNNGAGSGDGLTAALPAETAADYYLALRQVCAPPGCVVAAGDFGSNGNLYTSFIQNCTSDSAATLCSSPSYMDTYKHSIVYDAPNFGFTTAFRPETFAYHGWDDVNNYINSSSHCTDPQKCTIRAFVNAMSESGWTGAALWDTEVAAGQNPQANPSTLVQACAASFLLDLTSSVTTRITRIYYTQPYEADGLYWSLFDSTGAIKPAFTVLADRNTDYIPPAGSSCP